MTTTVPFATMIKRFLRAQALSHSYSASAIAPLPQKQPQPPQQPTGPPPPSPIICASVNGDDTRLFGLLGNLAHFLSLGSTLAFAAAVFGMADTNSGSIIDPQWYQQGFCVANANVPSWNSHDICSCLDIAAAVILGLLYLSIRRTSGMQRANALMGPCILGFVAMGVAHAWIGHAAADPTAAQSHGTAYDILSNNNKSKEEILLLHLPSFLFWSLLLRMRLPSSAHNGMAETLALTVVSTQMLYVPVQLGFVYVRTVLLVLLALHQILQSARSKDFAFTTFPILVTLPLSAVTWLESTQCDDFVRDKLYGHAIHDVFACAALLAWYALCYLHIHGSSAMAKSLKRVKFV